MSEATSGNCIFASELFTLSVSPGRLAGMGRPYSTALMHNKTGLLMD